MVGLVFAFSHHPPVDVGSHDVMDSYNHEINFYVNAFCEKNE